MVPSQSSRAGGCNGFTLIEVAIVLAALGLIATFILPRLGEVKEKAYIAAMKNDLRNYATAEEQYFHNATGGYGLPSDVETEKNFAYSENVHPDSSAVGDRHWYLRVRHDKTEVKCELDYRRESNSQTVINRIQCPGAGGSDEEPVDNSPPLADFSVASGTTSASTLSGFASLHELHAAVSTSGDGELKFGPNSDITFDGSLSSDPNGDALTYTWRFEGTEGVEVKHSDGEGVQFTNRWLVLGSYDVTLIVTDEYGAVDDTTKTLKFVESNAAPAASFTFSPSSPVAGETITFNGQASDTDGQVESYYWSFGGLGTSSREDPTFTFDEDGTYTVAFYATDDVGATGSADTTIVIGNGGSGNATPMAGFDWSPSVIEPGEIIQFNDKSSDSDGSIVSHFWGFEGEGSSTEEDPTVAFDKDGAYNVSLTVTDDDGATAELTRSVKVGNERPVADFTWSCDNLACDFFDQSSDPDGVITTWAWQFADQGTSTDQNPSHIFPSFGSYPVTLRVTDNDGATASVTKNVAVDDTDGEDPLQSPNADFTWSPTKPDTGEVVRLTNVSSHNDGTIVSHDWDFNGLGSSNEEDPTFVFPTEGDHPVTLSIEDDNGLTDQVTKIVPVGNQAPNADFSASCVALDCNFTDASKDSDGWIEGHNWTFGENGPISTEADPTHSFPAEGGYEVMLQVTDDDSDTDQVTRTLFVGPEGPVASFDYSPGAPMTLDTVAFDATASTDADGTIASYAWDLDGDGTEDESGATADHVYQDDGSYAVELTVTDNDGLKATLEKTVSVGNRKPYGNLAVLIPSDDALDAGVLLQFLAVGAGDADGSIDSYRWDFDDGTVLTGPGSDLTTESGSAAPFDHTYEEPGNYNVTLKLIDDDGASHLLSDNLQVGTAGPTASISYSPSFPNAGESVEFTGTGHTADGVTIEDYQWTFDGSSTESGATVTHAFGTEGDHVATLRVVDSNGLSDEVSVTVKVVTTARPSFTLSDTRVQVGETVTASVDVDWTSSPEDWSYTWNWGNATSGSGSTDSVTYSSADTYTIALTAHHTTGIAKTVTREVTVDSDYDIDFTWFPADVLVGDQIELTASDPSDQTSSWAWTVTHLDGSTETFSVSSPLFTAQDTSTTVQLVGTSQYGYQDTVTKTITAEGPTLNPSFTVSDSSGNGDGVLEKGESLTFDGTGSTSDLPIVQWDWAHWDTKDGSSGWWRIAPETDSIFQWAPPKSGHRTILLQIRDERENHDHITRSLFIEYKIDLSISMTDRDGGDLMAGDDVDLSATVSGADSALVDHLRWGLRSGADGTGSPLYCCEADGGNFADGNPVTIQANAKAKSIWVAAKDSSGAILATASKNIDVTEPTVDFAMTDTDGGSLVAGDSIALAMTISPDVDINPEEWHLLDGNGVRQWSSSPAPTLGVWAMDEAVRLIVDDWKLGVRDTVTKAIDPGEPTIAADFNWNDTALVAGDTIELSSTTTTNSASGISEVITWQFTDPGGVTSSTTTFVPNASHLLTRSGDWTVRLIARTHEFDTGEVFADTASKVITVGNPTVTVGDFSWSPTNPVAGDSVTFTANGWDVDSDHNDLWYDWYTTPPGSDFRYWLDGGPDLLSATEFMDAEGDWNITLEVKPVWGTPSTRQSLQKAVPVSPQQ